LVKEEYVLPRIAVFGLGMATEVPGLEIKTFFVSGVGATVMLEQLMNPAVLTPTFNCCFALDKHLSIR
jgi:hypothetical protein